MLLLGKNSRKKQDEEFDLREEAAIHPYMMTKLSQFANNREDTGRQVENRKWALIQNLKSESEKQNQQEEAGGKSTTKRKKYKPKKHRERRKEQKENEE